jgi:hypothetical protein
MDNQQTQINSVPAGIGAKPKGKFKKVLIGLGVLIIILIASFGFLAIKGLKDRPIVEGVITEYMQLVSNGNFEDAYNNLTSSQLKSALSFDEFEKTTNLFKAQYSGFNKLEFKGFKITTNTSSPTIYSYSGIVTYANGNTGDLIANLVKEDGKYKIAGINIDISL